MFYVAKVICLVLMFSESTSSIFLIFWVIAYVWLLLLAYNRLTGVWRVELSGVMSANHLHQPYKASSHFDHIPFIPTFYALVSTLKHCMSRIDNMWVLGSSWWGRNLLPCIQTFGSYNYVCLLCHAMLVDVDWVLRVSMTDVRLLINGFLKVATLTHIWVDWGTCFLAGLACISSDRHPGSKGSWDYSN